MKVKSTRQNCFCLLQARARAVLHTSPSDFVGEKHPSLLQGFASSLNLLSDRSHLAISKAYSPAWPGQPLTHRPRSAEPTRETVHVMLVQLQAGPAVGIGSHVTCRYTIDCRANNCPNAGGPPRRTTLEIIPSFFPFQARKQDRPRDGGGQGQTRLGAEGAQRKLPYPLRLTIRRPTELRALKRWTGRPLRYLPA